MTISETHGSVTPKRGGRKGRVWLWYLPVAILAFGVGAYWFLRSTSSPVVASGGLDEERSRAATLPAAGAGKSEIGLRSVGSGFREVVDIQFIPGSSDTAIILEKAGTARLATFTSQPVRAEDCPVVFEVEVRTRSELGLLGLAYHPRFDENGLFYVNYNPEHGPLRTIISEWRTDPKALATTRASETRRVLEVRQPYPNHDGGGLVFGPDGLLYIGMGDGGAADDPLGNGQKLTTLLGAMLRIDVDSRSDGQQYGIPKDNPFVGRSDARPEIWAYGLRNPWRFSFAPDGRLIVADVGQDLWEEISIVSKGANMGWAVYEASHCFKSNPRCGKGEFVDPVFEYGRQKGGSVTGGFVYLGQEIPELKGKYIFGDYLSGRVWAMDVPKQTGQQAPARELGEWSRSISTFGRNASGELFIGDLARGEILRLVPRG